MTFFFSQEYKHANIQVLSPTVCTAKDGSAGYKFAIMEPSLCSKGNKKYRFAYRMKSVSTNNWVGVGICHKDILKSKNYGFTFS